MNQNETGSNSTWLSIPEYSKTVKRSRQAVYEDIAAGRIPAVRFGPRCLRIPVSFIETIAANAMSALTERGDER